HYYISSRKLSAAELLHHARMEWAVETMHWLLDVHYGEDYCRIENRTIQQNLNLLRKFSISLLKQYKVRISSKRAMSKIMLDCLLESSKICEVLEN
ncbi:MAG: ISAs1 family transposase, partial [Lachnospiraceae bacterium]|nr:ISAs1 family transposase [Lachnospiraceae bacterium]